MIKLDEKLKEMIDTTHEKACGVMSNINESLKSESIKNKDTNLHQNFKLSTENFKTNDVEIKEDLKLNNILCKTIENENSLKDELKEDMVAKNSINM